MSKKPPPNIFDLPEDFADDGKEPEYPDQEQQELDDLNEKIRTFIASINGLSYCLYEMRVNDEISNDDIKKELDTRLPEFMENVQRYVTDKLRHEEYDDISAEGKECIVDCNWPEQAVEALFSQYGVSEDELPVRYIPDKLEDNTVPFFESVFGLHEAFYETFLKHMGYNRDEMPPGRIFAVAEYAQCKEGFTHGKRVSEWFPDVTLMIPQETCSFDYEPSSLH